MPDGSESDLQRILALKGTKSEERKELLQQAHNRTILTQILPSSSSSFTSFLSSSSSSSTPNTISPPASRPDSPATIQNNSSLSQSGGAQKDTNSTNYLNFLNSSSAPSTPSVPPLSSNMPSAFKTSLKSFLPDFKF